MTEPKKCPVRNCRKTLDESRLLCRDHWYSIPRELREQVWTTYREDPGGTEHRSACSAAIRAANRQARADSVTAQKPADEFREFMELVARMREAQRIYFKGKRHRDKLLAAKKLEDQVDRILTERLRR